MFSIDNAAEYYQLNKLRTLLGTLGGGYIAGGVFKNIFNNEPFKDVDVFFHNEQEQESVVSNLICDGYDQVYDTPRSAGFNMNDVRVDCVKTMYGNPESVIGQFDFTIAKFALYIKNPPVMGKGLLDLFESVDHAGKKFDPIKQVETEPEEKVVYHNKFFEHLHLKKLVIDDIVLHPVNTFERSLRYTRYGYNLCRGSKVKLLTELIGGNIDPTTISAELAESLYAGID